MAVVRAVSEAEARFDAIRRRVGLVLAPICFVLLLWIPMPSLGPQAHALAAVATATVVLWVTEAIPLAAAALLGPAIAVVLGVTTAKDALAPFADPLIFLFMGGFMLAGGLSRQGFDRRSALWLVSRPIIAGSPARALVAIAVIAFAFSMWISNTATTAMLIPVALGLHATIRDAAERTGHDGRAMDHYGGGMFLTLAYAASLGGAATPIGTGPNVIAIGMLSEQVGVELDFVQWMSFGVPAGGAMLAVVLWLAVRRFRAPVGRVAGLTEQVDRQLAELGPPTPGELRTVLVFLLAVVGWLTPSIVRLATSPDHPWAVWANGALDEGVVAIVCATLLFFIPAGNRSPKGTLLTWNEVQNIDWGTLFLLGGGLALGRMTFKTGLADAIGHGIIDLAGPIASHPMGLTAAAVLLVIFLTEVTSNTATTSMMLPVLIGIASAGGIDPLHTAISVTLAASFAFMLPVSTPPNAMAYGTRMVRLSTMIGFGFRLDLLGYCLVLVVAAALLPIVL